MLKKLFRRLLFSLILLSNCFKVYSAPCCGAGFTIPSIITSEDKAQLATSYSRAKIHADVFTNGDWKERLEDDITETFKLEGAHIFWDRFQAGFSLPYQARQRSGAQNAQSYGLGDISLQVGLEYLPDWNYNPYRPKGIVYLSVITPTGRSIYESKDGSGIDARGRGLWGLGIGAVHIKRWGKWDANSNIELHYSLPKEVHNKTTAGTVKPSGGGSFALGGGVNFKNLRLGSLINWSYEGPNDVSGTTSSNGELKRFATGSVLLSYMLPEDQSVIMSYSDQTIFGSPYNTSLSKAITLFYQKRWQR